MNSPLSMATGHIAGPVLTRPVHSVKLTLESISDSDRASVTIVLGNDDVALRQLLNLLAQRSVPVNSFLEHAFGNDDVFLSSRIAVQGSSAVNQTMITKESMEGPTSMKESDENVRKVYEDEGKWEVINEEEMLAEKDTEHSSVASGIRQNRGMSLSSASISEHYAGRMNTVTPLLERGMSLFPSIYVNFALSIIPFQLQHLISLSTTPGTTITDELAQAFNCNPLLVKGITQYMRDNHEFAAWCVSLANLGTTNPRSHHSSHHTHKSVPAAHSYEQPAALAPKILLPVSPKIILPESVRNAGIEIHATRVRSLSGESTPGSGPRQVMMDRHLAELLQNMKDDLLIQEKERIRREASSSMSSLFAHLRVPMRSEWISYAGDEGRVIAILEQNSEVLRSVALRARRDVVITIRSLLTSLGFEFSMEDSVTSIDDTLPIDEQQDERVMSGDPEMRAVYWLVREAAVRMEIIHLAETLAVSADMHSLDNLDSALQKAYADEIPVVGAARALAVRDALNESVDSVEWEAIGSVAILAFVDRVSVEGELRSRSQSRASSIQESHGVVSSKESRKVSHYTASRHSASIHSMSHHSTAPVIQQALPLTQQTMSMVQQPVATSTMTTVSHTNMMTRDRIPVSTIVTTREVVRSESGCSSSPHPLTEKCFRNMSPSNRTYLSSALMGDASPLTSPNSKLADKSPVGMQQHILQTRDQGTMSPAAQFVTSTLSVVMDPSHATTTYVAAPALRTDSLASSPLERLKETHANSPITELAAHYRTTNAA